MRERRYVTCDVFTDQPFGGNPLAVVLDADGLDAAAMQAIAREFNYSETTFVLPPADPAHTAHVRIFTPQRELPFAGHPNVGTAFVLATEGDASGHMTFEEGAGLVPVVRLPSGGFELTAPQPLRRGATAAPDEAAKSVSLSAASVVGTPVVAGMGVDFLFVEILDRGSLRAAALDRAVWAELAAALGAGAIYLHTRDGGGGFDLHARMLWAGLGEDPATGSAAVALAGLLAEGGEQGWRIEQGRDMGRPSTLLARTVMEGGVLRSAHVGGQCVAMMRGVLRA